MREVAIIGVGMIPFGRRDEDTLMDMPVLFQTPRALFILVYKVSWIHGVVHLK